MNMVECRVIGFDLHIQDAKSVVLEDGPVPWFLVNRNLCPRHKRKADEDYTCPPPEEEVWWQLDICNNGIHDARPLKIFKTRFYCCASLAVIDYTFNCRALGYNHDDQEAPQLVCGCSQVHARSTEVVMPPKAAGRCCSPDTLSFGKELRRRAYLASQSPLSAPVRSRATLP